MSTKISRDAEVHELGEMIRRLGEGSCECGHYATRSVATNYDEMNALTPADRDVVLCVVNATFGLRLCDRCDYDARLRERLDIAINTFTPESILAQSLRSLHAVGQLARYFVPVEYPHAKLVRRHHALLTGEP